MALFAQAEADVVSISAYLIPPEDVLHTTDQLSQLGILDQRRVFGGTLNADPRSIVLNTEVSLMIESPELAAAILSAFSTDLSPQNSWRVMLYENRKLTWHSSDGILNRHPAGSLWRRVGDFFVGLLPIDEQM